MVYRLCYNKLLAKRNDRYFKQGANFL
ncbi:hypothetical protein [Neobacillus sp. PS2-9]